MAYILDGTEIRAPQGLKESNSTQVAQNRTLDGTITRDFFGANKRTWRLEYEVTNPTDYSIIKAVHTTYLGNNTAVSFEITESNYTVASTTVHVDLVERSFGTKGTDYLSSFTLILTEV